MKLCSKRCGREALPNHSYCRECYREQHQRRRREIRERKRMPGKNIEPIPETLRAQLYEHWQSIRH